MKRFYRAGVIGLGRIGFTLQFDRKREQPASHSAALSADKSFILSGGFDRDITKMETWSRRYPSAKIYENLNEMLSDDRWDLLVVAVDESSHLPVIEQAARVHPGIIVLEKPVAPSIREAEKIKKICIKENAPVVVNHERRFSRDYVMVSKLLSSGRLGKVRTVHGSIFSPNFAWRRDDLVNGRGTLIHDGTHILDTIRFLTGENVFIEYAIAFGKNKNGDIDGIGASGTLGKNTFLTLDLGFRTKQFGFEIELNCENGRIRIGNGILEVSNAVPSPYYEGFYSLTADRSYSVKKIGKTGYFSGMVRHCADVLDGQTTLCSSLDDGIEAMSAVERIADLAGCI